MRSAVTMQRETFSSFIEEAKELLREHWQEICWKPEKFPLEPDNAKYLALEKSGALRVFTVREDGILVGYALFFVSQHIHYKSIKVASNDVLYVAQTRRGVWLGARLIRFAEDALMADGVQTVVLRMKKDRGWAALAERSGYECVDMTYMKWTGA